MTRSKVVWGTTAMVVMSGLACGGDFSFTPTPSSTASAGGALGTGSAGGASGTAGSGGTAGAGGTTGAGGTLSTATSTSGVTTAASTVAATTSTTTGGGVDKQIPCGKGLNCPKTCCIGPMFAQCADTTDDCGALGVAGLACNNTSDCTGGNVCCFAYGSMAFPPTALCASSCGDVGYEQLCGSPSDCPPNKSHCETLKIAMKDTPWKYCKP